MAKKPVDDRRRKLDELKKKQKSTERRGTVVAIVVSLVAAGALITGAVMSTKSDPSAPIEDIDAIGVAQAEAGCAEVKEDDPAKVSANHVNGQVAYPNPPSSGNHNPQPAPGNLRFYARDSDRAPEQLVHNLEHGYVVVWYDDDLPQEEVDLLQSLSRSITDDHRKFIVSPWRRGKFEGDANVAMTAWARQQLCSKVSGAAIKAFAEQYDYRGGKSVAPEKNAA